MNLEKYKGKKATIKSTGVTGTISNVIPRKGNPGISIRFIVVDDDSKQYELMPHEIVIEE